MSDSTKQSERIAIAMNDDRQAGSAKIGGEWTALRELKAKWLELADSAECYAEEAKRHSYPPEKIESHARTARTLKKCAADLEALAAAAPAPPADLSKVVLWLGERLSDCLRSAVKWNDDYMRINHLYGKVEWVEQAKKLLTGWLEKKPAPSLPEAVAGNASAPVGESQPRFRKVVEWLHMKMAAAQNLPYEDGDVCLECADAVRDELRPLMEQALAGQPSGVGESRVRELESLIIHMWIHSGHTKNGYQQMTTPQKALYDSLVGRSEEITERDMPPTAAMQERAAREVGEGLREALVTEWLTRYELDEFDLTQASLMELVTRAAALAAPVPKPAPPAPLQELRQLVEASRDGFLKDQPYILTYSDIIERLKEMEAVEALTLDEVLNVITYFFDTHKGEILKSEPVCETLVDRLRRAAERKPPR